MWRMLSNWVPQRSQPSRIEKWWLQWCFCLCWKTPRVSMFSDGTAHGRDLQMRQACMRGRPYVSKSLTTNNSQFSSLMDMDGLLVTRIPSVVWQHILIIPYWNWRIKLDNLKTTVVSRVAKSGSGPFGHRRTTQSGQSLFWFSSC